jgi:hypothetical protein
VASVCLSSSFDFARIPNWKTSTVSLFLVTSDPLGELGPSGPLKPQNPGGKCFVIEAT